MGSIDSQALERVRQLGGEQLVADLVELGLESMRAGTAAALAAVESGDAEGLRLGAHAMRSSAANVGAVKLAGLAEQVEKQADQEADARRLVAALADEFIAVERALGEIYP